MQASHAPAAELRVVGDHAELKLGDATFKLPMLPAEEFTDLFQMPPMPRQTMRMPATFFDAIQHCLLAVSDYATIPDQLGVTLMADGCQVRLFATDVTTLSYARVELPDKCVIQPNAPGFSLTKTVVDEARVTGEALRKRRRRKKKKLVRTGLHPILPTEFCQQMLKLAAQAQTARLALHRDYVVFLADDVILYGRLLKSTEPLDFKAALRRHLPQDFAARAIPMPSQLGSLLKRAACLADIKGNESRTKISVKDGIAKFHTQSDRGVLDDTLAFPGHPDVQISTNAALLLRACAAHDKRILITEGCVIVADATGDQLYLLASEG